MESMTIGKVAKLAEMGIETIRFYERKGLVDDPPRRHSGYRQYPPATVQRLKFIRRAKDLGFTLREIGELLSLKVSPDSCCREIKEKTLIKIKDIEKKITALQRMRNSLAQLARTCVNEGGPTSECPILGAFGEEE